MEESTLADQLECDVKNPLFVFDFDDTLISSDAMIRVTRVDGTIRQLTTDEFARYHVVDDDELEFDERSILTDEIEVLPLFDHLLDVLRAHGRHTVIVLTARSKASPPRQVLRRLGAGTVTIVALGTPDVGAKARWLDQKIRDDGHDAVFFFDDNKHHVRAVQRLTRRYPDVTIIATRVS